MTDSVQITAATRWLPVATCLALGACYASDTLDTTAPDPAQATYEGILDAAVTLHDGRYEGQPYVAGGAARPLVTLLETPRAAADMDGDGLDEIAVLLAAETGGSGTFVYLAVIPGRDAGGRPVTVVLVGDRVRVTSLAISGAEVHLALVEFAQGDPMCCPSSHGERRWSFSDGALVEAAAPAD